MLTTEQIIDRAVQNLPKHGHSASYYRLAKLIGITDVRMSQYRHGRVLLNDELALKISPFLELPPEIIFLWLRMEREKNPDVLAVLERMEQRLSA